MLSSMTCLIINIIVIIVIMLISDTADGWSMNTIRHPSGMLSRCKAKSLSSIVSEIVMNEEDSLEPVVELVDPKVVFRYLLPLTKTEFKADLERRASPVNDGKALTIGSRTSSRKPLLEALGVPLTDLKHDDDTNARVKHVASNSRNQDSSSQEPTSTAAACSQDSSSNLKTFSLLQLVGNPVDHEKNVTNSTSMRSVSNKKNYRDYDNPLKGHRSVKLNRNENSITKIETLSMESSPGETAESKSLLASLSLESTVLETPEGKPGRDENRILGRQSGRVSSNKVPARILSSPGILVKFLYPRVATESKLFLSSMQATWKEIAQSQAQQLYEERLSAIKSKVPTGNTKELQRGRTDGDSRRNGNKSSRGRSGTLMDIYGEAMTSKAMKISRRLKKQEMRRLRKNVVVPTLQLYLPDDGYISTIELAEFLDLSPSKVLKYIMNQLGVIVDDANNIEIAIARELVVLLKGEEYIANATAFELEPDLTRPESFVDTELDVNISANSAQLHELVLDRCAHIRLGNDSIPLVNSAQDDSVAPSLRPLQEATNSISLKGFDLQSGKRCTPTTNLASKGLPSSNLLRMIQTKKSIVGTERDPVVTILGHVDHGKTTLLDFIRNSDVASHEFGGITQVMKAFKVITKQSRRGITFIDTPGHAVFKNMRSRGANMTDIAVLVIAADDGIMEQTIECIEAVKASNIPILVAINKIDKEGVDPNAVLMSLLDHGVVVEDFGGDIQSALISARSGSGVEELLEKILLQADIIGPTAASTGPPSGVVIDGIVDKKQGIMTTLLVQQGTLNVGDILVSGSVYGRVKRILDDSGTTISAAGPTMPVQVSGFNAIPTAGELFKCALSEADAKKVVAARSRISQSSQSDVAVSSLFAEARALLTGARDPPPGSQTVSENLPLHESYRKVQKLPVVIKADSASTLDAIASTIRGLSESDEELISRFDIVHASVGELTTSDIDLASCSKAQVVGFHVAAAKSGIAALARSKNVNVFCSYIIYDIMSKLETILKASLTPPLPGTLIGRATVLKVFHLRGKKGSVAGCVVKEGKLVHVQRSIGEDNAEIFTERSKSPATVPGENSVKMRVIRNRRHVVVVSDIACLRIEKQIVSEVGEGKECGVSLSGYHDFVEGDVLECFQVEKSL